MLNKRINKKPITTHYQRVFYVDVSIDDVGIEPNILINVFKKGGIDHSFIFETNMLFVKYADEEIYNEVFDNIRFGINLAIEKTENKILMAKAQMERLDKSIQKAIDWDGKL